MPGLARFAVRLSLLYLLAGFSLGGVLLLAKAFPFPAWVWRLLPLHLDLALFGWILQLVFGVAHWILPRFSRPPARGSTRLFGLALFLLNAGIMVNAVYFLLALPAASLLAGRILQVGAALTFTLHAWPRVKAYGT